MAQQANQRNLLILENLPVFRGRLHKNEDPRGTTHVNLRSFLRSLEIFFDVNGVVEDHRKVKILFNQISKEVGDALSVASCYAGRNIDYQEVKEELLAVYPQFESTDFLCASKSLAALNFDASATERDAMTRLEIESRAVVDSYLSAPNIQGVQIFPDTLLSLHQEPPEVRAPRLQQARVVPPQVPPRVRAAGLNAENAADRPPEEQQQEEQRQEEQNEVEEQEEEMIPVHLNTITVHQLLQNFLMKYHMAAQLDPKIFEKISNISPASRSTKLMAEAIQAAEKQRLTRKSPARKERSEFLYHVPTENSTPIECYNCGKLGHYRKECRVKVSSSQPNVYCQFCKYKGHTAKKCLKRIKGKVAYCDRCDRLGHEIKDCRSENNVCSHCKKRGHTFSTCRSRVPTQGNTGKQRYPQRNNPGRGNNYDNYRGQRPRAGAVRNIEDWDDPNEGTSGEYDSTVNIVWEPTSQGN